MSSVLCLSQPDKRCNDKRPITEQKERNQAYRCYFEGFKTTRIFPQNQGGNKMNYLHLNTNHNLNTNTLDKGALKR